MNRLEQAVRPQLDQPRAVEQDAHEQPIVEIETWLREVLGEGWFDAFAGRQQELGNRPSESSRWAYWALRLIGLRYDHATAKSSAWGTVDQLDGAAPAEVLMEAVGTEAFALVVAAARTMVTDNSA